MFENLEVMSNQDYHSNKEAIGHSSLVKMLRTPAHFFEYFNGTYEPTKAMLLGTAVHAAILEPEEFAVDYAVVNEEFFANALQSLDDYKAAADKLGVAYATPNKDELKVAIKAADVNSAYRFKEDVQAEMAARTQDALIGTLQSLDEFKAAAVALGIDSKLKKDELKVAIKAADVNSAYRFKEDVQAEMAAQTQDALIGTLQSLDDYKTAGVALGVRIDALTKDELKVAIKAADVNSEFSFKEDVYAQLYSDKVILTEEQMNAVLNMRENALSHKAANKMLTVGKAELSGFWTDPVTGIKCKFRRDWNYQGGILDVKSARDASAMGFAKAISTFGYDLQAAYYIDGAKAVTGLTLPFYFLAIENTAPYAVAVYRASDEMVETGRKKYQAALELLKWCRETDQYPSYQPFGDVETIDLPKWDRFDDE